MSEGRKIVGNIVHRQMLVPTSDNLGGQQLAADVIDDALREAERRGMERALEAVQSIPRRERQRGYDVSHNRGLAIEFLKALEHDGYRPIGGLSFDTAKHLIGAGYISVSDGKGIVSAYATITPAGRAALQETGDG